MAYLRESEFSGATHQDNIHFNGGYSDIKDNPSFRSLLIICPLINVRASFMLDAGVSPLSHYRSSAGGYEKEQLRHPRYRHSIHELDLTQVNEPQEITDVLTGNTHHVKECPMPFIICNTLPKLAAGTLTAVLTAAVMTPAVAASSAPNPAEAYISSVSANGNGCPPGTWEAAISPDGKAFTVTFSAYETLIEPGDDASDKECTLSLNVHTPPGTSLSTAKFSYQGYALMDQAGMSATQSASYDFLGTPVPAQSVRSQISGPHDDTYLFSDRILLHDNVASAQGATRALNGKTGLVLTNNPAETGSGFFNTTSVDGTLQNGPGCTIDRRTATSGQTIIGTSGADVICGSPFADVVASLGGDDVILSFAGNDRVAAGAGNDTVFGGNGTDDISGDAGNDTLNGEDGNDRILGGPGTDTANGGPGTDSCVAETTTSC